MNCLCQRLPAVERMMRIIMTDDPTGSITPVHIHFLPTRLPAPGTSPGWIYRLLVQASRAHAIPEARRRSQTARDAAWEAASAFFELARQHLRCRITVWLSSTLTYHHHRLERFFRNAWPAHIVCTESEAASVCDTLRQRGLVSNVHHSVAMWDSGCCVALQDEAAAPTRAEIIHLIVCARAEQLLSVKLRTIGLARTDRIWCYPEWPLAGRYCGNTMPEVVFGDSGTPSTYERAIL